MHVHCKLDSLLIQGSNDIHQSLMAQGWWWRLSLVLLNGVPGKFVYQSLHSSGAVNIQRNINYLVDHAINDHW